MYKRNELIENINKRNANISEVLCRKYLAKEGDDIVIWKHLFIILLNTKNNKEILILVKELLLKQKNNPSYLLLCIEVLLDSNNHYIAREIFQRFDLISTNEILYRNSYFYHLILVENIKNKSIIPTLKYEIMHRDAHRFNEHIINKGIIDSIEVICYIAKDFHFSIQCNVANELLKNNVKVLFSNSIWFIKVMKPKVILTSEALNHSLNELRDIIPDVLIVNTRHGLGDKNHAALGASRCDKICASSESVKKLMMEEMLVPESKIWVTGYPQLDEIHRSSGNTTQNNGAAHNKTIIFAPTFNKYLSAAYLLQNNLVNYLRGVDTSIRIVIKPHPHLFKVAPEIIAAWLNESRIHTNVYLDLLPESNIMNYFNESSLMISDVSSAALAWLSIDKPLICLIDRNIAIASGHYDPDGLEWKLHEAVTTIKEPTHLSNLVRIHLNNPDINSSNRKKLSNFLFGSFNDGKSSFRVSEKIIKHLGLI